MSTAINSLVGSLTKEKIKFTQMEDLRRFTTFKIGGPAAVFCMPHTVSEVEKAISLAKEYSVPYCILGKGSNVLFSDDGYNGMILHTGYLQELVIEDNQITVGAGVDLAKLCLAAAEEGLSGLEFAYGIPGSVGGAIYMNAGAFGGEICQVISHVISLNDNQKEIFLPIKELDMEYRTSIFQSRSWCILSAKLALKKADPKEIMDTMQFYMNRRKEKQPWQMPSAGSAFKRPPGAFAAALIDQSGLKGFRVGDAAISEKHSGFIVNYGNATCRDVLQLADEVVRIVAEKTGYRMEKEIRVMDCGNIPWE